MSITTQSGRPGALLGYGLGQGTRMAWYLGNYLATRSWFARIDPTEKRRPTLRGRLRGARIQAALSRGALALMARDAAHVRNGTYPMPADLRPRPAAVGEMAGYWRDLPRVALRRRLKQGQEPAVEPVPEEDGYPRYYLQNFHYQSGGWLTEESADLYDTQVEVLFGGLAQAMRRQGVVPVVEWLRARGSPDGPGFGAGVTLLDLATGTGAMLEAVGQAAPALDLHGLDLSRAYLDKAQRRLAGRDVTWHRAKAEAIPLPDGSVDLVTASYLFHELPKKIRAEVLAEVRRVLRPGGRLVLVDSLQLGDTPALDPVLRSFPEQFHEPYYADWIGADVPSLLAAAGFAVDAMERAYLSKVFVGGKR